VSVAFSGDFVQQFFTRTLANKGGFHENPLSDGEGISTRNIPTS
jgi:hypothetical protein